MRGSVARSSAIRSVAPAAWRDLAPDLAELAERAGREHRIEHELAERAGAHLARQHRMRAPSQSTATTLAKMRKMAKAVRSARDSVALRAASKACSTSAAKRADRAPLQRIGLHRAHAADRLRGEGGGVGEAVLREARPSA